jgi:hypothetical protein
LNCNRFRAQLDIDVSFSSRLVVFTPSPATDEPRKHEYEQNYERDQNERRYLM